MNLCNSPQRRKERKGRKEKRNFSGMRKKCNIHHRDTESQRKHRDKLLFFAFLCAPSVPLWRAFQGLWIQRPFVSFAIFVPLRLCGEDFRRYLTWRTMLAGRLTCCGRDMISMSTITRASPSGIS